jgi:MoaA/NifB/PqqE/SkfB family radical SAM enzyme
MKDTLEDRYRYSANYIPDYEEFKRKVINKTIVPHQVEFQPGPVAGHICWLKCPYCYGKSAIDTKERLHVGRWMGLLNDVFTGGVKKVIFAGYATDPLNYTHFNLLLNLAIANKMVWGINTKLLNTYFSIFKSLSSSRVKEKSYISISVDAGTNTSYNLVHGIKGGARTYDRVLRNTEEIGIARRNGGYKFDMSATYLVCGLNNRAEEIMKFVADFKYAGCNLIRFTFPQPPRGSEEYELPTVPDFRDQEKYKRNLLPLIEALSDEDCKVIFVDADLEYGIYHMPRSQPCVARWVYPTIGFDGWLYHCSQSSAPNFRDVSLGDMREMNFWNAYYNYDVDEKYFENLEGRMEQVGCRCDRKEHLLNLSVEDSGIWG